MPHPPLEGGVGAYLVGGVCKGRVTRPLRLLLHLVLHRRGRVSRPLRRGGFGAKLILDFFDTDFRGAVGSGKDIG